MLATHYPNSQHFFFPSQPFETSLPSSSADCHSSFFANSVPQTSGRLGASSALLTDCMPQQPQQSIQQQQQQNFRSNLVGNRDFMCTSSNALSNVATTSSTSTIPFDSSFDFDTLTAFPSSSSNSTFPLYSTSAPFNSLNSFSAPVAASSTSAIPPNFKITEKTVNSKNISNNNNNRHQSNTESTGSISPVPGASGNIKVRKQRGRPRLHPLKQTQRRKQQNRNEQSSSPLLSTGSSVPLVATSSSISCENDRVPSTAFSGHAPGYLAYQSLSSTQSSPISQQATFSSVSPVSATNTAATGLSDVSKMNLAAPPTPLPPFSPSHMAGVSTAYLTHTPPSISSSMPHSIHGNHNSNTSSPYIQPQSQYSNGLTGRLQSADALQSQMKSQQCTPQYTNGNVFPQYSSSDVQPSQQTMAFRQPARDTKTMSPKDALLDFNAVETGQNGHNGEDNGMHSLFSTNNDVQGAYSYVGTNGNFMNSMSNNHTASSWPTRVNGSSQQFVPTSSTAFHSPTSFDYNNASAVFMNHEDNPEFPTQLHSSLDSSVPQSPNSMIIASPCHTPLSQRQQQQQSQIPQSTMMTPLPSNTSIEAKQQSPFSSENAPEPENKDSYIYVCSYRGCSERFPTAQKLQKHKREIHRHHPSAVTPGVGSGMSPAELSARNSQAGPHRCMRINPTTKRPCNIVFSRPYDLTRHEDTIHNLRKQKVRCALCLEEKTFSRSDALTRHMRVVHPQVDFPGKYRKRGGSRSK